MRWGVKSSIYKSLPLTRGTRRKMTNSPLILLRRYLRKCHESKYLKIIAPLGRYLERREDIHVVGLTHQTSPFDLNHDDFVDIITTKMHRNRKEYVQFIDLHEQKFQIRRSGQKIAQNFSVCRKKSLKSRKLHF